MSRTHPAYRNRYPCVGGCWMGYLDCAALARLSLKCCADCSHPDRWTADPAYTPDEIADMNRT